MIKRRQILIDRTFQTRLAVELMVIVLVVPVILWVHFFVLGQYALTQSIDITSDPGEWGVIGALVKHQWLPTILFVVVSFGLVYGFIMYYTNRIAGPVYRFCRALDALAQGQIGHKIQLRKNDYFENLGNSMNQASDSLGKTLRELKAATAVLTKTVQSQDDSQVKEQVRAIEKLLEHYDVKDH